jgi:plasmid stability protein
MDTTIRNLDPKAHRALRARAALAGKTVVCGA